MTDFHFWVNYGFNVFIRCICFYNQVVKELFTGVSLCNVFTRLQEGLDTLGVLQALQRDSALFCLLVGGPPAPLTAQRITDLFKVNYSERGTSRRLQEERAVGQWRDWLIDMGMHSLSTIEKCQTQTMCYIVMLSLVIHLQMNTLSASTYINIDTGCTY